eukprot:2743-Heterococcus_DN1.PRE.1
MMCWLLVLVASSTEAFNAQMLIKSRTLQQYLRLTPALPLLARGSERPTTMAALPAGAGGYKGQKISAYHKEKSLQMELAAEVKRVGRDHNWRAVIRLLDTAAFKPNTFVWREAIAAMGGQWQEAMNLLDRMEHKGVQPD